MQHVFFFLFSFFAFRISKLYFAVVCNFIPNATNMFSTFFFSIALADRYTQALRGALRINQLRRLEDRQVKAALEETELVTWQLHCLRILGTKVHQADVAVRNSQ